MEHGPCTGDLLIQNGGFPQPTVKLPECSGFKCPKIGWNETSQENLKYVLLDPWLGNPREILQTRGRRPPKRDNGDQDRTWAPFWSSDHRRCSMEPASIPGALERGPVGVFRPDISCCDMEKWSGFRSSLPKHIRLYEIPRKLRVFFQYHPK